MLITQVGIALFGVTSIFLANDPRESWRRWAPIVGLAGQPFWFIETATASQWLIFGLAFLYTYSWWRGFRAHWWPKKSLPATQQGFTTK